jgi:DNA modification methylase
VFTSSGAREQDTRFHHWGQNESGIADLIRGLTEPGQLVVDPFLGGGTAAVVCRDLGRRFIGCDVDAAAVQTSRERIA